MIDSVLFDCWGTLVQAPDLMRRGASVEYFYRSLTANGCRISFDEFSDAYMREARRQHEETKEDHREFDYVRRIDATLQAIGFDHPERRVLAYRTWKDYLSEWPRQSTLYEETPSLLSSIRGTHKLGLVTNFPDGPTAREVFENLGFHILFASIVVSDDVGFRKPNRILFEKALEELDSAPEMAVMVGDTFDADVLGAKNVGMKAVLIDADGGQADNYGSADAVVKRIGEVGEILKRL